MNTLTRRLLLTEANYRAWREGLKEQTRRVMLPQPTIGEGRCIGHIGPSLGGDPNEFRTWLDRSEEGKGSCEHDYNPEVWRCPQGPPGTRLALTEPFRVIARTDHLGSPDGPHSATVLYRWWRHGHRECIVPESHWYTATAALTGKWHSSRFMPLWATRCWAPSTAVRVEFLRDITDADCVAEGALAAHEARNLVPRAYFAELWDTINAKRGYSWAGAGAEWPGYVWAITFGEPREES